MPPVQLVIVDVPRVLVRRSRRAIPFPEPLSLSPHIEGKNESIIVTPAGLGVVANAADQNVCKPVTSNVIVARTTFCILDGDVVGDCEAAEDGVTKGNCSAARGCVVEGGGAEVDGHIA